MMREAGSAENNRTLEPSQHSGSRCPFLFARTSTILNNHLEENKQGDLDRMQLLSSRVMRYRWAKPSHKKRQSIDHLDRAAFRLFLET